VPAVVGIELGKLIKKPMTVIQRGDQALQKYPNGFPRLKGLLGSLDLPYTRVMA
jgi:hypothetical protein